jgi:hypothetical protein
MKRIPRPQGTTYLSIQYQKTNQNEDKDRLYSHIINLYVINGFMINGRAMSIPQLSKSLSLPTEKVMEEISNLGTKMGSLASTENINNTVQMLVTLSTTWAIQDRGKVQEQLELLLKSQGNTYKPFVTGEVSKTLKVLLDSNKNIMEVYRTFFTSSNNTTNILNLIQPQQENEEEYLTTDTAIQLLQSNESNNNKGELLADNNTNSELKSLGNKLFEEYRIGDLENVKENRSGAEALIGLDGPSTERPKNLKAKELKSQHDDSFNRRGIEVEDIDELP